MRRYIAFLRAINVGGRNVSMRVLKAEFERLGFREVDTFIASGNIIFKTRSGSTAALERRIEKALRTVLGYEVATFVRTDAEVTAIAEYQPFAPADMARALAMNVGFVAAPILPQARRALQALATDVDAFHVHDREVYWMCQRKQSESTFSNVVMERALTVRATFRGMNTISRLAARLAADPGARARGRA